MVNFLRSSPNNAGDDRANDTASHETADEHEHHETAAHINILGLCEHFSGLHE